MDFSYIKAKNQLLTINVDTDNISDDGTDVSGSGIPLIIKQVNKNAEIFQYKFDNLQSQKELGFEFLSNGDLVFLCMGDVEGNEDTALLADVSNDDEETETTDTKNFKITSIHTNCEFEISEGVINCSHKENLISSKSEINSLGYPSNSNNFQFTDSLVHINLEPLENQAMSISCVEIVKTEQNKEEYKLSFGDYGSLHTDGRKYDSSKYKYCNVELKTDQIKSNTNVTITENLSNGITIQSSVKQLTGSNNNIGEIEFIQNKKEVGHFDISTMAEFSDSDDDEETTTTATDDLYDLGIFLIANEPNVYLSGSGSTNRNTLTSLIFDTLDEGKELIDFNFSDVSDAEYRGCMIENSIINSVGLMNDKKYKIVENGIIQSSVIFGGGVSELTHSLITEMAQNQLLKSNKNNGLVVGNDDIIDLAVTKNNMSAKIDNSIIGSDVTVYSLSNKLSYFSNTQKIDETNPNCTIVFNGETFSEDIVTETQGSITVYSNHSGTSTINLIEKENEDDVTCPINVKNMAITSTGQVTINIPTTTETPTIQNIDLFEGSICFTGSSVSQLPPITVTIYKDVEPSSVISGISLSKIQIIKVKKLSDDEKEQLIKKYKYSLLLLSITKDETLQALTVLEILKIQDQLKEQDN